MVLRKRKKPASQTLDLHGIKHKDARRMVWEFIEDHVGWGYDCTLTIITGQSVRMRDLVKKELAEYHLGGRKSMKGTRLKVEMEGWRDGWPR